jgi:DNA-binding beta-propeller fold protein YncE
VAVDSSGNFYLSDYYHHVIDVFRSSRGYVSRLTKVDPLDGPCALALDAAGNLYVNNFHRNVEKFTPSLFPPASATIYTSAGILDASHPTGVAVDPVTGNVYVNERNRIAAYGPTGTALAPIGAGGAIEDGYGLARSGFFATPGYLYVPDAATDTVKVFDPATDADNPIAVLDGADTPNGHFASLRDAAIAVDNSSGEVYVTDNLQPEYAERPETVVYVFDSTGTYEGRLKFSIVNGVPPGLAVDNSPTVTQGRVYVTSGNTEAAVLYGYPPGAATSASVPLVAPPSGGGDESGPVPAIAGTNASAPARGAPGPTATASEIAQKGTLRVSVAGKLAPKSLPRKGAAPISVSVGGEITTTDHSPPPQLQTLGVELNRNGHLDYAGLPTCPYERIQPASSQRALSACRSSLVGEGSFTAEISLAGQTPYPTKGKLLLFNAKSHGKPVLFGQIYSPRPFATSFVIVFELRSLPRGSYGIGLSASLPAALSSWGNLTGIEMTLQRRYSAHGQSHSYISAGCPAPEGFGQAVFPLARTSFGFEGGKKLTSVLSGTCKVR